MRTSIRGGVMAEVAVVVGIGLIAVTSLVVLVAMGVRWFSGQLREHADDPRVTLVGNTVGKAATDETAPAEKTGAAPATSYSTGTLTDKRDAKTYKTAAIGGKTWMAENLSYKPDSGRSWCYDNSDDNCRKYGRLYDWYTAKTACPAGWRLASIYDWDTLLLAVGGKKVSNIVDNDQHFVWENADKLLKAKGAWGGNGNGTDNYGFSALPGGGLAYIDGGIFYNIGTSANWWTVMAFDTDRAASRHMNHREDLVSEELEDKGNGLSVRCVADK
jgi:uncharacterized protein (TIGR02145 family)